MTWQWAESVHRRFSGCAVPVEGRGMTGVGQQHDFTQVQLQVLSLLVYTFNSVVGPISYESGSFFAELTTYPVTLDGYLLQMHTGLQYSITSRADTMTVEGITLQEVSIVIGAVKKDPASPLGWTGTLVASSARVPPSDSVAATCRRRR
eukprot:Sspe_Gene.26392::Locus_10897_Transcript_1_1_Confidence_1.000_Length_560::g.26392::m.26392